MKIKNGFALRQVVDTWVVLPFADEAVNFSGMLTLNETGAVLWKALEQDGDRDALIATLTAEYDVTAQQAGEDVDAFLEKLMAAGCID